MQRSRKLQTMPKIRLLPVCIVIIVFQFAFIVFDQMRDKRLSPLEGLLNAADESGCFSMREFDEFHILIVGKDLRSDQKSRQTMCERRLYVGSQAILHDDLLKLKISIGRDSASEKSQLTRGSGDTQQLQEVRPLQAVLSASR
jgi:hypothetical protein